MVVMMMLLLLKQQGRLFAIIQSHHVSGDMMKDVEGGIAPAKSEKLTPRRYSDFELHNFSRASSLIS